MSRTAFQIREVAMPGTAFQISLDDILEVLRNHRDRLSSDARQSCSQGEIAFSEHLMAHVIDADRAERAALHADDLDKQTEYAQQEILAMLVEKGVVLASA